jgi:hypothetical protein
MRTTSATYRSTWTGRRFKKTISEARTISYLLYGAAITLLPLGHALADSDDKGGQFIPSIIVSSTVPANGDQNPYGVAFVPPEFPQGGLLKPGDLLVSNFNNSNNKQGTGTTIIKLTLNGSVAPSGSATVFFQGPAGATGLTTALGVLKRGFVLVGNLPTNAGVLIPGQPGSLLIIDKNGHVVATLSDTVLLDGPWDLTIHDEGDRAQVFVSNVLNGTVTRIDLAIPVAGNPIVESLIQIASGYGFRNDRAALVVGPTGLAYDAKKDVLYVASTDDNKIFKVLQAGRRSQSVVKGAIVFQNNNLRGPLGLVLAPNGDLITSNGDAVNADPSHASEIVEFTKNGKFVGQFNVDAGQGGAFGIGLDSPGHNKVHFAAVDDNANDISVHTLSAGEKGGEESQD